jgi:hypothetical protein
MEFKKAVKRRQRLRLALDGISGSGKTYTALAVASGMGGSIAVIDTEHGSAALYADRFDFDTLELQQFQIEDYIAALQTAAAAGYAIVIVDSTSHAWDALVERVDRIASQRFGGNSFRAWGEGSPLQRKLIEALLSYPGHVIVTCRSKTEYSVDKDNSWKTTIKKVGAAAVQRQGFEYEFTMAMTLDANHVGLITKDRTGKFQDKFIEKPGQDFGVALTAWLQEGADAPSGDSAARPTADTAVDAPSIHEERRRIAGEIHALIKQQENDKFLLSDAEVAEVAELSAFCKKPGADLAAVKERVEAEITYRRAQFKAYERWAAGGFHIDPDWARKKHSGDYTGDYAEFTAVAETETRGEEAFEDDIPGEAVSTLWIKEGA